VTLVGHEVNRDAGTSLFDSIDGLCDDKTAVSRVSIRLEIGSPRLVVLADGDRFAPFSWVCRHQYDLAFERDQIAINSAGIARDILIVVDSTEAS
jgi:hypothetical protein